MLLPSIASSFRAALFAAGIGRRRSGRRPTAPHPIPEGFLGICVAAAADPAGDDYITARLRELGIRHIRLDLTYPTEGGYQLRLLPKLLEHGHRVCLHLVQPRAEARLMSRRGPAADAAAERWRAFVENTLKRWGADIECVEVGATCNRRKWSGQSLAACVRSWQIAWNIARKHNVKIIGPNVTDFEPIYNFLLLDRMRRLGCPPDAHTDNLFVERATEPENYDHKILGYKAAGLLRYDLIRKARLLQSIGAVHDAPVFICSHTAWSLRRIARFLETIEEKQADYLARYLLLAAASGTLERVYWGPMIGQREGLIDDGTQEYPDPPHVTLYQLARGRPADYRIRPAFHAMSTIQKFLQGATFEKEHTKERALKILEFKGPDGDIRHAVWTVNGRCAAAAECYTPTALASAKCIVRDGQRLPAVPAFFSESPTCLSWSQPIEPMLQPRPTPCAWWLAWHHNHDTCPAPLHIGTWRGIYQTRAGNGAKIEPAMLQAAITPVADTNQILRAARNRVWRIAAPWQPETGIIVKQFKVPDLWRRCLDVHKPPKALRSWNGAQELLRRGLATPSPLACLLPDDPKQPAFYICADFRPDYSVRDIFTAFSNNTNPIPEISPADWYASIAEFIALMHNRGVFFRDLSAGNLLLRRTDDGKISYALIDTARAWFTPYPLPLRRRLSDLKRICHPLPWPERRAFLTTYMRIIERTFRSWMLLPLVAYDWKHHIKRAIKPLRRKR